MTELDSRIKLRSSLRCDGIGRLDCAEDLESGQRLAVRWLPLEANGEAAVKACERLPQHPMLPRIRQTGKMGSMAFLALDFPEGSLLSTILGDRLDTGVVLQMAAQLADALATVHGQGVVHGEFGSDSVLMVGDKSYLWDLPLVIANRLTDRRGENRLMQNLVRVVPYLAPERARGAGASCEADVYSLGALLCVCAGAPMPADSTTLGTVYSIAQGQWVPRVPSTIPQPYHAMIEKMISADATERPAAQDVAKLFSQPMHSGSLPTVPDMPMIRLPPELQARANALLKSPPPVPEPVEAEVDSEVSSAEMVEPTSSEAEVATASTPIEAVGERELIETPAGVPSVALGASSPLPVVVDQSVVVSLAAAPGVVDAPVVVAQAPVDAVVEPIEPSVQAAASFAPVDQVVVTPTPAAIEEKVVVAATAAELDEVPEAAANDVLRLPTIEIPKVLVVESTPAVMVVPEPTTSVALTDSVSVSPEMVQAGAGMFSLYTEPPKQSMGMWWVAGGAVVVILSLLVFAVNMVGKATAEKAMPPHAAVVAPVAPVVEAAPVAPAAQPLELKEVAPASPEAAPSTEPAAVQPAPAAVPETGALTPVAPRSPVVEAANKEKDDVLAPLARAKGARVAVKHARKAQSIAAPVIAAPAKVTAALIAQPSEEIPLAPLSASGAPIEYAPVAVKTPAVPPSPDDFFPEPPVKPSRADAKQPTP